MNREIIYLVVTFLLQNIYAYSIFNKTLSSGVIDVHPINTDTIPTKKLFSGLYDVPVTGIQMHLFVWLFFTIFV